MIQLSALKIKNDKILGSYNSLINPGNDHLPLSSFIENFTGIKSSELINAPSFNRAKIDFLNFVGDLPWLGHNIVQFDIPFLYRSRLGLNEFWAVDTYLLAKRKLNRYILGNLKLPTLKKYYQINNSSHNALDDCYTTHFVYQHLKNDELNTFLETDEDNNLDSLKDIHFAVIGKFPELDKTYLINQITFRKGILDKRIIRRTNFVVKGITNRTYKTLARADKWGFKVISFSDFVKLVNKKDSQVQ